MAKRAVSIKQLANAADVSTATVSNVFSGNKPVSPELAAHVRKTARALGYRANRVASNLRSGRSRVVTALVPDLSDPFFISLVTEIEDHAQRADYDIIVANAKDDARRQRGRLEALLSWQPAGMIAVPISDEIPKQLMAARKDLPIVITDRGIQTRQFDAVCVDNFTAGTQVADHLIELGHKHILLVASDMGLCGVRERCRGAIESFEAIGGSAEVVEVGPVPNLGVAHLGRWLDGCELPTAIFAVTDMTTLTTLTCLAERKADIGKDVSVVGFDDYPWMSARRVPLTAVRQPIEEIARAVWDTLMRRIGGDKSPVDIPPLACSLRVRASTQPARSTAGRRKPIHKKRTQH